MFHTVKPQRQRLVALLTVLCMSVGILSVVIPGIANASQITSRSITMSDSGASAGNTPSNGSTIGTGVNVTYSTQFTIPTAGVVKGVVVAFCDNTPFVGDTGGCTAITGFSGSASPTVSNVTGLNGTFTAASGSGGGGAANHVTILTNSGSPAALTAGTTVTFDVSGYTNPSTTNHAFYARIMTYASDTTASAYTDTIPGAFVDSGGIALSTANIISITARVQETLVFCVSGAAPTANCGGVTPPGMTLGHGTSDTLDSTTVDTGTAYSQVSTNALSGIIIRMRNSNLCGGLSRIPIGSQTSSTGCDIPPINNNSGGLPTAASQEAAGTAAFGVNVSNGTVVSGGSGTVTANSIYNNTGLPNDTSYVGMNTTASSSNAGVSSTYGDAVASSTSPVSDINNAYTFAATASNITPAGIYTANMALIATGTY